MSQPDHKIRKRYAIYAITKHGLTIAKDLQKKLHDCDLWVSEKFLNDAPPHSLGLQLPMGPRLEPIFFDYDCHIFIISVGAVVRLIAPLIKDKKIDPAVICIDDNGQYAISLLSGHVGRGNEFTHLVAKLISAQAIVTTASDVRGTLTVDILGRELGWKLEDMQHNITRGCAAVVNERPVLFVQETGDPDFWPLEQALPPGVDYAVAIPHDVHPYEMLLIATDRSLETIEPAIYEHAIVYRPKSLVIGIGCDRDTPKEMLARGLQKILDEHQLSIKSIAALATIDAKANESGLVDLCLEHHWPLITYSAAALDQATGVQNPSETVKKYMGTKTVAEGAALLTAECDQLLVSKQKYFEAGCHKNMTIAICRKIFRQRYEEKNHAQRRTNSEKS
ncbi:MAG: cobalt-precorrin 5A hydrolase [Oligoflexus sp.]